MIKKIMACFWWHGLWNGVWFLWTLSWTAKKHGWANSHHQCARTGTAQSQRNSGRNLDSTANLMMFVVVRVIMSCTGGRSPKFGAFFAIPNQWNHSGVWWLNFLYAELRGNDPVPLVGAIVWIMSHCRMTLWAYIDYSRVSWHLWRSFKIVGEWPSMIGGGNSVDSESFKVVTW